MKIFSAGMVTETNTFAPVPTGLADFRVQRAKDGHSNPVEHSSFDLSKAWGAPAAARGFTFAQSLMAWAEPSGITTRIAYETLREELLADLKLALPVDVVLLMLHGAMVAEGYDDCEEDLLRRVRNIVGGSAVIAVELDLHCHLSPTKIAPANLVMTYKEYPHTDINDRAKELFELAVDSASGKINPTMALFECQMVGMYPTTSQPLRAFVDAMIDAARSAGVLSLSLGHGFQFADVPHVGAKVLAVTDNDRAKAERVAHEFGMRVYALRDRIGFDSLSLPMEVALPKALGGSKRPVVVADQSDNTGGGAPGDATYVLRWLMSHGAEDVAMAIFYDPEVVKIARKSGHGAKLSVRLGGKMGMHSGDPVDLDVTVGESRASYMHAWPQQSGDPFLFPTGDIVALRAGTIDIVVSSERCQCFSPTVFSDLGIDPTRKRLLVTKSYQHFYNAFAPIAAEIIYMSAPGAVPPDPRQIAYTRLDTTRLYPWVNDPLGTAP
jgi:microcystin degradation protein MlrC